MWAPFDGLRREIDQLFESFGGRRGLLRPPAFEGLGFADPAWDHMPAADVAERDGGYEITVELPGLDEKDVEVRVADGFLTIRGTKRQESETREKGRYLSERSYGSFARSFRLPRGVTAEGIKAKFAKGVLTVAVPRPSDGDAGATRIAVTSG